MSDSKESRPDTNQTRFSELNESRQASLFQEFIVLMMQTKKWWLAPVLLVFAVVGVLVALASTGAAPFIYTLF